VECRRQLAEAGIERQRQGGQQGVFGAVLEIAGNAHGAGDHVAVREDDAFRFAGTARGVEDGRHVGVDHPVARVPGGLQQFVPAQAGQRRRGRAGGRLLTSDQVPQIMAGRQHGRQQPRRSPEVTSARTLQSRMM
jgi:hypothetical protein